MNGEGNCRRRGGLTRAPLTRPLDERAAADEEEEPVVESVAVCGEGGSVLQMRRAIDSDHLEEPALEAAALCGAWRAHQLEF